MEKYLLVILGAIIGFIASITKDYFVEKTKRKYKEIELKREKAEELYLLLTEWSKVLFLQKQHLVYVMKKEISYREYQDYIIKNFGDNTKFDFKRIDMLINIYFKNLLPFYNKVLEKRDLVNKIQFKFENNCIKGTCDYKINIKEYMDKTYTIVEEINVLKNEITNLINNLK
jgi:hypothetical protein